MANRNPTEAFKKRFESFKRRIEASKHAFWFEVISDQKKLILFKIWKEAKFEYKSKNKSLSLNKFLFNKRQESFFFVKKEIIRENALNKILNS